MKKTYTAPVIINVKTDCILPLCTSGERLPVYNHDDEDEDSPWYGDSDDEEIY